MKHLLHPTKVYLDPQSIITHPGNHHRDEVTGIALLEVLYDTVFSIQRKTTQEIGSDEFENPRVIILDVGKQYNPAKNNYDHHQDKNSPAANMLILEDFLRDGVEKELLRSELFQKISDEDISGGLSAKNIPDSIGKIIDYGNYYDGFRASIDFAKLAIGAILQSALARQKEQDIYDEFPRVEHGGMRIVIADDRSVNIMDRKALAKDENEIIYISKSNQTGNITVRSRNLERFRLEHDQSIHQDIRFIHPGGFYGEYVFDVEQALEYVKDIIDRK